MKDLSDLLSGSGFDAVIPCKARETVIRALPDVRCEWLLLKRHSPYAPFPEGVPAVSSHYSTYQAGYEAVQALVQALRNAGEIAYGEQHFPVKPLMVAAGVGFQGKHTLIIHREYGTYFCALQLQTAMIPAEARQLASVVYDDPCGSCQRCVQACPVQALDGDYHLVRERCIRQHMLSGEPAPPAVAEAMKGMLVGCEYCQKACPYNRSIKTVEPPPDLIDAIKKQDIPTLKTLLGRNLIRKQRFELQMRQAMPPKEAGDGC